MPMKFSGLRKAKKRERSRKSREKNNTETGPAGNREEGQRREKSREEGGREEGSERRDEAERSAEGRMVWSDQSLGHPRSPGSPGETERDLLWNLQGSIFHRCPGYRIPRPGEKKPNCLLPVVQGYGAGWEGRKLSAEGESDRFPPQACYVDWELRQSGKKTDSQVWGSICKNLQPSKDGLNSNVYEIVLFYCYRTMYFRGFPGGASGKWPSCQCRSHEKLRCNPWIGKVPQRRVWQITPVFLPGKFHRQRSLVPSMGSQSRTQLKQLNTHTVYFLKNHYKNNQVRANNLKIYMKSQKTQNFQSNHEEKEQSWRHNSPRLQTILQSYSNQNSMVLLQKWTCRSTE